MKYIYKSIKNGFIIAFLFFISNKIFVMFDKFMDFKEENNKQAYQNMIEIEREKNFNLLEVEKIKIEGQLKIIKEENTKLVIKSCFENRELNDFIDCIKILKGKENE